MSNLRRQLDGATLALMSELCIYCRTAPVGSDEHILQSGLGATWSSKLIVCGDCNLSFSRGDKIDDDLVDGFQSLRSRLWIFDGRGEPPPRLAHHTTDASGRPLDLLPGGRLAVSKTTLERHGERVTLSSGSAARSGARIPHVGRQFSAEVGNVSTIPTHALFISSESAPPALVAQVVLFGVFRFMVLLCEDYSGPAVNERVIMDRVPGIDEVPRPAIRHPERHDRPLRHLRPDLRSQTLRPRPSADLAARGESPRAASLDLFAEGGVAASCMRIPRPWIRHIVGMRGARDRARGCHSEGTPRIRRR